LLLFDSSTSVAIASMRAQANNTGVG